MKTHMVGRRPDGSEWPLLHGTLEVGPEEAEQLVYGEWAEVIPEPGTEPIPEPETVAEDAPEPDDDNDEDFDFDEDESEEVPEPEKEAPVKPAVNDSKADWVAYAVAKGMDRSLASSMTKRQIMDDCDS